MRKLLILVPFLALLAACAGAPLASGGTAQFGTLADVNAKLDNAIAIAKAGNDPQGEACWVAVKGWVATLPLPAEAPAALPDAVGVSGTIETLRVKQRAADAKLTALKQVLAAGVPDSVKTPCAVVVLDAQVVGAKVLGAVGLIVK